MIKKISKTTKIVLLVVFLVLLFITFVYGEDKIGQGDVVDLTDSKPKEGVVFAVCIFAVGEDGTWHIIKILGRYEPAYKKKKSYN